MNLQSTPAPRKRRSAAALLSILLAVSALALGTAVPAAARVQDTRGTVTITANVFDVGFAGQQSPIIGTVAATGSTDRVPTGTVTVISNEPGKPSSGPSTLDEEGVFFAFVYPSKPGTRTMTVKYSGDQFFKPATVVISYFIFTGPETKTTLTASPRGTVAAGREITFTAHVTDDQGHEMTGPVSGEITFFDNGVELTGGVQTDTPWTSTYTISTLSPGTHTITAFYEDFIMYGQSTSNTVVITVKPPRSGQS